MKWHGKIGYAETTETSPGVWEEIITEYECHGDMLQIIRRLNQGDMINDDINISNKLSIVMNPFFYKHYYAIRYATIGNAKWKVVSVDLRYPRLELSLGGLYNGMEATG